MRPAAALDEIAPITAVWASPAWRKLRQCARLCWESWLRFRKHRPRRLRLCESLALGERRFVAVVEFEQTRFLVGGTSASLVLLARLDSANPSLVPLPNSWTTASREEPR